MCPYSVPEPATAKVKWISCSGSEHLSWWAHMVFGTTDGLWGAMVMEGVTTAGVSSLLFCLVLLHSTGGLQHSSCAAPSPPAVTRKIRWGSLSSRHYCQACFPSYKPLHQQKTGGSNAGEPLVAITSPTSTPGAGSRSDGPKNLFMGFSSR